MRTRKAKKKEKDIRDSHPLNLPPDQLRRLSAAMSAQENAQKSKDIDSNGPSSSPKPISTTSLPKPSPGAFPDDANGFPNGVNGEDGGEDNPSPPPHQIPILEKPSVDPEAAKAAGNKYFKAKDYPHAIAEYTKGR